MRTVTVRQLQKGEEVRITKRERVIARLVPDQIPAKMPDFLGRMRAVYGDKVFKVSGAEVVRWDRDRY
ncbi:MAG TPA: hypothetical protein VKG65_03865 [Terriglobales bacterium]|nr:hypothetical protein [Terriglobales bacterium]